MSELPPRARQMLQDYCRATEAPAGAARRGWQDLAVRTAQVQTQRRRIAVVAGLVAVAAVVVGTIALRPQNTTVVGRQEGFDASHDQTKPTPRRAVSATAPAATQQVGTSVDDGPVPVKVETESKPARSPPAKTTPRRPHAAKPDSTAVVSPAGSADALQREASLMAKARESLQRGDHSTVLDVLAQHRREFPQGSLVHERRAWKTIALCRSQDPRAAAARHAFVSAHPNSRWTATIGRACTTTTSGDGFTSTGSSAE